ncbi:DNA repair protein RadA [Nisaea acidiphila]|uniref:DNA repair protein RadA n=1 Tax=Nisaea acidiphila TaxID=1862145 RepID=A0A9J7AQC7_9PROT|nr:DNA repair protein RadA [Nisaea acidiphila]UUX49374.1 DNA repair protein RadA [Nisaea acidiphila]
MAKNQSRYVCQECGGVQPKWAGKCDACGAWNTLVEEVVEKSAPKGLGGGKGRRIEFHDLAGSAEKSPRRVTKIAEFDRVAGGGLVPGSVVLIGGDPGIGKSTLLLQVTAKLSELCRCAYVSGEEALDQVRMRAQRLGVAKAPVQLAAATSVRDIVTTLDGEDAPDVLVIDSIQTMYVDAIDSAPGTVSQVRASAQELIRVAKRRGIVLLLVGHVTKEGTIAGPRVLEHMVDTVLYFEGERGHQFRILRGVKNRFGPTDEIGVFEMTEGGLAEVTNPSALFLGDRQESVSGACVFAGMEGTRPLLVEIQALVAPSPYGTPRRAVIGWDAGRLAMVTAVLEARCGVVLAGSDVFLNVAGGLKVGEPAADLAVAAALLSSLTGKPVPSDSVVFGEIGLSAEIRAVAHAEARLKEAAKLGFGRAILPEQRRGKGDKGARNDGLSLATIKHLHDLVAMFQDETSVGRKAGGA